MERRSFSCFFHFLGPWCWQLGIHVCPVGPNIEIHIPFGFIKLGWAGIWEEHEIKRIKTIGYHSRKWTITSYNGEEG